uniref:Uncharacterized protein n=1 Tax=Cacopsylla melanoneura TaxID=428564 RepID=A0A8D9EAM5_9HEMI
MDQQKNRYETTPLAYQNYLERIDASFDRNVAVQPKAIYEALINCVDTFEFHQKLYPFITGNILTPEDITRIRIVHKKNRTNFTESCLLTLLKLYQTWTQFYPQTKCILLCPMKSPNLRLTSIKPRKQSSTPKRPKAARSKTKPKTKFLNSNDPRLMGWSKLNHPY